MRKGKGSVNRFGGPDGKYYHPGDVVDLPVSYKGAKWLECLETEKPVKAPAAKIKKVLSSDVDSAPKKLNSKKSVKASES